MCWWLSGVAISVWDGKGVQLLFEIWVVERDDEPRGGILLLFILDEILERWRAATASTKEVWIILSLVGNWAPFEKCWIRVLPEAFKVLTTQAKISAIEKNLWFSYFVGCVRCCWSSLSVLGTQTAPQ